MTPERWQMLKGLCEVALEREPSERNAFLANACSGDEDLRLEALSMIARASTGGGILDGPIWEKFGVDVPSALSEKTISWVPTTVGHFRILRVVGEGGMGVVYEAEQDRPRRHVALKVIKLGWSNSQILRRFDREAEALARLHHSGIAQVYETGTAETDFGPLPYFAMEFIHGESLGEYARDHNLGTRNCMALIAKICDAVEHAHQNGIIHRDLKPGNILVDEVGQPKILDFGVARLTDSDAQFTKQTDAGQLIGTLAYMSPEQVLAEPGELDCRTDIYSLGVILYELLANRLPYRLSSHTMEAIRTIREEDPAKLSSINRRYHGDVETIVGKALEKDKARRYSSAAALAADIRRYLADQPIMARPASTSYQLRKFARRHKALVSATAIIFVVLIAGVVVSTREAVKARRAEQISEAVNDFLQSDLLAQASSNTQASPSTKPDPHIEVRTVLDRAAANVGGKLNQQPEVEAAIRCTIGRAYKDLGLYVQAGEQLERALALYSRVLGPEDSKTLAVRRDLGSLSRLEGKTTDAERILAQTLTIQRRVLGPENRETLSSMLELASIYGEEGKYPQADELTAHVMEIFRRVAGPQHPDTLKAMNNLALLWHEEGKDDQAEKLDKDLLDIRRRILGLEHPDTLGTLNNLAMVYGAEGKYTEAEALYRQALDVKRRALGSEHPETLMAMNNLAVVEVDEGKFADAEVLDRAALEVRNRVLGPEHPNTLQSMHNLALVYYNEGQYSQAEAWFRRTTDLRQRVLGPEHPRTLLSMWDLALTYAVEHKYAASEALFTKTVEISRRVLGPEHPQTLSTLGGFMFMYQLKSDYAMAESIATDVLAGEERRLGPEHSSTLSTKLDLVLALISQRKYSQSEATARNVLAIYEKKLPDDWERFRAESLLGACLAGQRKYIEGEPLLVEGYQGMLARKDQIDVPDRYHLDQAHNWLINMYKVWGKPEEAAGWIKK